MLQFLFNLFLWHQNWRVTHNCRTNWQLIKNSNQIPPTTTIVFFAVALPAKFQLAYILTEKKEQPKACTYKSFLLVGIKHSERWVYL